jgi:hypothetical protein
MVTSCRGQSVLTEVWGAFYARRAREGKHILQNKPFTSVDMIRGYTSPSRLKEFSRDQWCDQLGRSLLHYWPFAWKHRSIRLTCAACYALGGVGALWVLGTKVGKTALFILQHSTFPWPWR